MALWPNARYMTRSTYKGFGVAPGLDAYLKAVGDRFNRYTALNKTASTPDGYDMRAAVPPIVAGGMSALRAVADMAGSGNALAGGPMDGTASVAQITGTSGLSLVVGLEGSAVVASLSGDGMVLSLTIGLDGTGSWSLTGTGALGMIVPCEGSGSFSLTGTSDLRGLLALAGEWTPFSTLSPENLAAAVWNALAAQYNDAGTMGAKLNSAAAGGVDLNALAQAVLDAAETTPIHSRVKIINDTTLAGAGTSGDPMRPA